MSKRNKIAYQQGLEAYERGWERISPYKGVIAEVYWYAGFDNVEIKNFSTYHHIERREFTTETCGPIVLFRKGYKSSEDEVNKILDR